MADKTISCRERLVVVRLAQVGVFAIVTVQTQSRRILSQVIVEFARPSVARLVGDVTGITTHVQSGVPAAVFCYAYSDPVTGETHIVVTVRS